MAVAILASLLAAALPRHSHHARHLLPRGAVVLDGGVGVTDAVDIKLRAGQSHGWQYDRPIVPMPNTSAIRLYMYDLPAHFNDALLTCYAAESDGAYPWQDGMSHGECTEATPICGQHKAQEVSQYAADVWLHRSLRAHTNLTSNPHHADVLFVPFYASISAQLNGPCNGTTHGDRTRELAAFLQGSDAFRKAPGRHAMALSHWDVRPVLLSELKALVVPSQMILLLTDPYFFAFNWTGHEDPYPTWPHRTVGVPSEDWMHNAFKRCHSVVLPYVPQTQLMRAPPSAQLQRRHLLASFFGNANLSSCVESPLPQPPRYCQLRHRIIKDLGRLPGFVVGDSNSNSMQTSTKEYSSANYVELVHNSTFCLMPRGDTPSSRRLFDAIVGGCIPVIISDNIFLPWMTHLDYSNFTVHIDESAVLTDPRIVERVLRHFTPDQVEAMQRRLAEVRHHFVFGSNMTSTSLNVQGGVGPMVLAEIFAATRCAPSEGETQDVALLAHIAYPRRDEWITLEQSWHRLRPAFSSLAIDLWDRPEGVSALDVRMEVQQNYSHILGLFDRVLFVSNGNRSALPHSVRSSVAYRHHFAATFGGADADVRAGRFSELHGKALPRVIAGLDARELVPAGLPIDEIADLLERSKAHRQQIDGADGLVEHARERARAAWVNNSVVGCSDGDGGAWCGTPANAEPVFVVPRETCQLRQVDSNAYPSAETLSNSDAVYSHWCDKENVTAEQHSRGIGCAPLKRSVVERAHAASGVLARGPWCPSSRFYLFHRDDLDRTMASYSLWREALDSSLERGTPGHSAATLARANTTTEIRWEATTCSMLAPHEAVLWLWYEPAALAQVNDFGCRPGELDVPGHVHHDNAGRPSIAPQPR